MRFRKSSREFFIAMPHCPVCQRTFSSDDAPAMPFCSERCRTIDLGRWLDEKYSLPVESEDEKVKEPPADPERI